MKRARIIFYAFFFAAAAFAAALLAAPSWVNHPFPRPHIKKLLHEYLRRNVKDPHITFADYRTDLLSYVQFDSVEVSSKNLAKHLIDRVVVRYGLEDLPRRKFSGTVNYGSIRVVFDAVVASPRDITVLISTDWMDAEELYYKILRKAWKKLFKDVSMSGKVRITAECRFKNGVPSAKGLITVKDGALKFNEYNLNFVRLNGYMPFYHNMTGTQDGGKEFGKVTAEKAAYMKLKFTNVKGDVSCRDLKLTFPKLSATFMKSQAEGTGRLWVEDGKIGFYMEGIFKKIDLNGFNELINNPEYRINGYGNGRLIVGGVGSKLKECFIRLASTEQQGTVNAGVIRKLLGYIPQNDIREKVEIVIKDKPAFVFTKGFFSFEKKPGKYEANLLLDGDHLLDFKINIDEELINDIIDGQ
jgi:hypothetical protein